MSDYDSDSDREGSADLGQSRLKNPTLRHIEFLYKFTASSDDSMRPDQVDVDTVRRHICRLRASDMDAVIEERGINGKCGYVLCRQPARSALPGSGKFVTSGQGKTFRILLKTQYENWCSEACIRRAMYLKAQLMDRPANSRDLHPSALALLPEEETRPTAKSARVGIASANSTAAATSAARPSATADAVATPEARSTLALERGELVEATSKIDTVVSKEIVNRDNVKAPRPPRMTSSSGSIEGYVPGQKRQSAKGLDPGTILSDLVFQ